jgi:hypothetical protein
MVKRTRRQRAAGKVTAASQKVLAKRKLAMGEAPVPSTHPVFTGNHKFNARVAAMDRAKEMEPGETPEQAARAIEAQIAGEEEEIKRQGLEAVKGLPPTADRTTEDPIKMFNSGVGVSDKTLNESAPADELPPVPQWQPRPLPKGKGRMGGASRKSKKTGKERTRFQPPRERGSKQYSRRSVAQSNLENLASLKKGSGGRRTRKHRRNTRRR